MAALLSKEELLGWYLITLKLRQTLESRLPKKSTYGGEIVPDYEPRALESAWVISIEEKLEKARQDNVPVLGAKLSIYRFPRHLKDGDDKDWVPQTVSVGPYHHGEERLRHMERHKWRCLRRILERSHQGIGLYLDSMKKVEERARACYEGTISMSSDEFVEMMVLDGCFVIELFRGSREGFKKLGYLRDDLVFSMRPSMLEIQRDMIMLENQIPLFILDRLLGLQLGDPNRMGGVAQLAIQFFKPLTRISVYGADRIPFAFDPLIDYGGVHCLRVFWRSLFLVGPKRSKTEPWLKSRKQLTPCLTALQEDGVMIRYSCRSNWVDIEFQNGILWIPPLVIHEGTRSLFLNLIALEQSHLDCSNYVTSYVIFMRDLISSPEDVRYLREREIIKHCLGSDAEVVHLFKRLCREVAFAIEDSHLYDLSTEVHIYCRSKYIMRLFSWRGRLAQNWNAWRAILKSKYFDNPWSIISFIAAFVLLVLTFTQTFYGVYGYYWPRS